VGRRRGSRQLDHLFLSLFIFTLIHTPSFAHSVTLARRGGLCEVGTGFLCFFGACCIYAIISESSLQFTQHQMSDEQHGIIISLLWCQVSSCPASVPCGRYQVNNIPMWGMQLPSCRRNHATEISAYNNRNVLPVNTYRVENISTLPFPPY